MKKFRCEYGKYNEAMVQDILFPTRFIDLFLQWDGGEGKLHQACFGQVYLCPQKYFGFCRYPFGTNTANLDSIT